MQDQSSWLSSLQILKTKFASFTKAHESATTGGLILVKLNHQVSGVYLMKRKPRIRFSCRKIIINRNTYQN
jgi:hypothetical protein